MWNRSTIFNIKNKYIAEDRTIRLARIGFRVYQANGSKSDEEGRFEGWSNKFDDNISIYSTRIQPLNSKTLRNGSDDLDLEDEYDVNFKP